MMAQQTILQQTVPQTNMSQVMEVRMLMVHSQVRINVQMLRTQKTRLHIPPVILKTSLCVIFLTALTAVIVYIKRRRNILWEARLAKRVKKRPLQQGSQ